MGKPLKDWDVKIYRGILTGCNEAFIIDGAKKDELIANDPKSAEIIRPILRGRDIKRYEYNFADLWIIATFPSLHYDIDKYPAVKKHLLSYGKERLEQTGKTYRINGKEIKARKKTNNKWFETQDSISYWDDFNKQKIIYSEITDIPNFALDKKGEFYINNKVFMICTDKDIYYLYYYLNSIFCEKYFHFIASTTGVGTFQWFKYKIEKIPIPDIYSINFVDKIINSTDAVNQLNNLWYALFKFNDNEINYFRNL